MPWLLPVLHYGVRLHRSYAAQTAKRRDRGGVRVDLLRGQGNTLGINRRPGGEPQTPAQAGVDAGGASQQTKDNKWRKIAAAPRKVISVGPGGTHLSLLLPSCLTAAGVTFPAYRFVRKL